MTHDGRHGKDCAVCAPLVGGMTRQRCIFPGCVSTDRHFHGGFPGGYDNPDDPTGPPIPFTTEPESGVRDYNGALLGRKHPASGDHPFRPEKLRAVK